MRPPHRPLLSASACLAALAAAVVAAGVPARVLADSLPTTAAIGQTISAEIAEDGDADEYRFWLRAGDTLTASVKGARPVRGVLTTLAIRTPDGGTAAATVKGQGGKAPKLTYTAAAAGLHTLSVTGVTGVSFGKTGNYTLTLRAKRAAIPAATFSDAAGGAIAFTFAATAGATADITATTKKGGFDLTEVRRPDDMAEAGFAAALKAAANRRKATVRKLPLTGGNGDYEVRGAYDAGSSVKLTVKVAHADGATKRTLGAEPEFDPLFPPFPDSGIAGTELNIVGLNFTYVDNATGPDTLPTFYVGGIAVDPTTVSRPFGSIYRIEVPAGLATGVRHDLRVVNADGQEALREDAFLMVPPPAADSYSPNTGGPAGGRSIRITGANFRSGSVVYFGSTLAQPTVVLPDRIDVKSPPHAPGTVSLRVQDEFGQSSTLASQFTYLDIGSNSITSANLTKLQGLGGEVVTVTGADFGTDTVFTLDGQDVGAQRLSSTQIRFTMPPRAAGNATLKVVDQYEQTDTLTLPVRGFTDVTNTYIPAPETSTSNADGWRATRVLRGDFSGDGRPDLVLLRPAAAFGGSSARSRVRLLRQRADGTYEDRTAADFPAVSGDEDHRARDGVLTDLDGDTDLDLAIITDEDVSSGTRSSLRIYKNASGVFTDVTTANAPALTTYGDKNQGVGIVATNVDGDSDKDLVILHTDYFTRVTTTITDPGNPPLVPPTTVVTTDYFAGVRVLVNDGTAKFTRDTSRVPAVLDTDTTQYQGNALAAFDADGNGVDEIYIARDRAIEKPASTYNRALHLLVNTAGTFADASAARLPAASDPEYFQATRLVVANADGDSDLDLFVVQNTPIASAVTGSISSTSALRFLVNSGGTFSVPSGTPLPGADGNEANQAEGVAVGDLTGDGAAEIFLVSGRAPVTASYAGRALVAGGSSWTRSNLALPHPALVDDSRGAETLVFDADGDGDLDILIARDDADETVRNLRLLLNDR